MKNRLAAVAFVALVFGPLQLRAEPIDELGRFAGTWQSEGTFRATPYSDAGASSATTTCAWSGDRLFMICQQAVTLQGGKHDNDVGIYTYDASNRVYRFFSVHTSQVSSSTITVAGNTITYPFSFTDKGKNVTIRTLNVWQNPRLYSWRTEYTSDGGTTWTTMASGTSHRI